MGGPQGRSGRVRKISSPTGIRSPDRPACSESLYRLSYPAHQVQELRNTKRGKRQTQASYLRWIGAAHGGDGEQERCVRKFGAET